MKWKLQQLWLAEYKIAVLQVIYNTCVTWADPDTHKPRRWKASSSPKVIYVANIPTMFAKHIEQVN